MKGFTPSKAILAPRGSLPYRGRQAACPDRGFFLGVSGAQPLSARPSEAKEEPVLYKRAKRAIRIKSWREYRVMIAVLLSVG